MACRWLAICTKDVHSIIRLCTEVSMSHERIYKDVYVCLFSGFACRCVCICICIFIFICICICICMCMYIIRTTKLRLLPAPGCIRGAWFAPLSSACKSQMPTATRPIINKNNAYRICMGGLAGNPVFPYIPQCSPVIPSFQTLAPRDSRPLHHRLRQQLRWLRYRVLAAQELR